MIIEKSDSNYDIDTAIMRVIASFFVILIHSSGIGTVSEVICNSISRFSVPVFVMVSGYYMLSHKISMRIIGKKSLRLFVLMIAWSYFYYCYELFCKQQEQVVLFDFLRYLLTEPVHLWYLYVAITLYLFTPTLYVFCNNATYKEWRYALSLSFFFGSFVIIALRSGVFPMLETIVDKMKVPYTLGFIFLYLLGGFFHKYRVHSAKIRLTLYLLGVLGVATTVIGTLFLPRYGFSSNLLFSFFAPNVIASAVAFFVFVKQFFYDYVIKTNHIQHFIHRLADNTLGIYLFHPFLIMIMQKNTWLYAENAGIVIILFRALIAWLLSVLIIDVVKRIPVLKKVV